MSPQKSGYVANCAPAEYVDRQIAPALASSYAHLATIGQIPEYVDAGAIGAPSAVVVHRSVATVPPPPGPGGIVSA